ncbi:MAG: class R serpentine receptor [Lachnobacterium sp.]|nr:class R serpentine receptor [Lachnobacterium sp.]
MRCGVKLTREYIQYLNDEINRPKEENQLKNEYLKKMSHR